MLLRIILTVSLVAIFVTFASSQEAKSGAPNPHERGNISANYVIEVFNDYQCPACDAFNETLKNLETKFPNKVRVVFRNYPIPIHQNAYDASRAAEAAGIRGKFSEMIEFLYKGAKRWGKVENPRQTFVSYARRLGLDKEKFDADYMSLVVALRIDLDIARARSMGIKAAPTVLLNNRLLSFAEATDLERIISEGN